MLSGCAPSGDPLVTCGDGTADSCRVIRTLCAWNCDVSFVRFLILTKEDEAVADKNKKLILFTGGQDLQSAKRVLAGHDPRNHAAVDARTAMTIGALLMLLLAIPSWQFVSSGSQPFHVMAELVEQIQVPKGTWE